MSKKLRTFVVLNETMDDKQGVHSFPVPPDVGDILEYASSKMGVPQNRLIEVSGAHGRWDIDTNGPTPVAVLRPPPVRPEPPRPDEDPGNISLINKVRTGTATPSEVMTLIAALGDRITKVDFTPVPPE